MCKGEILPQWQADTIRKLLEEEDVQLELLILDQRIKKKKSAVYYISRTLEKIKKGNTLWVLYNHLHVKRRCKSNRPNDLSGLFEDVPVLKCLVNKKGKYSEYFTEEDVESIKSYNLDFILRFGFGIIRGEILQSAKYGIWSFHHDDVMKFRGHPPCFWEIYFGENVTGSVLQKLTNRLDGGVILKKGYLKTQISYVKNRDQAFFESTNWPRQLCVDIRNGQTAIFESSPSKSVAPIFYPPSDFQFLKFQAKSIWGFLKKAFKSFFYTDYWNIGVAEAPIQAFLEPDNLPEVKWYPNLPKNKFIADPFGLYYNDTFHVIYESFLFKEGVGKISACKYDDDGFSKNGVVIDEQFHLSYPFVFEHENNIYCIPETAEAKQIRLYKAVDFPHKWKFEHVLIDQYAGIDNTLFRHDGHWWLFSTDRQKGHKYNLRIFYSESIFGKWQEHPKNPVKTDIRSARPARTLFRHNGSIFRPSMDYSEKVEGRIVINKILKLTKFEFQEESYCIVNPYKNSQFPDKIHTLCETGPYTIIDGAKELFIFSNFDVFKYKLNSKLRKLKNKLTGKK